MYLPQDRPVHRWTWPTVVAVITLLALALRWYYVTTAMVVNPIRGDAIQYYAYAWNLIHHGMFSGSLPGSGSVVASNYRDPGYPTFLALWMRLFRNEDLWYAAVLLSQAALSALIVPLAMQLGRRWLNWRWATAAGVLMAVWPHNIAIASDLLSETLFGFLCTLALWLCANACEGEHKVRWALAAGICFGAAALTNAVLLPFGVLAALYLAWRRLIPWRVWVALLASALILPAAWGVRNRQLPPEPLAYTSTGRALQNLVIGSWPAYHAAYRANFAGDPRAAPILDAVDHEYALLLASPREGASIIMRRMRQQPMRYLFWYTVEKPWSLWNWDIQVGQGGIYVYPVAQSPFESERWMRALKSACMAINPLLADLMLVCLLLTLIDAPGRGSHPAQGQAALESVLLLVVFATAVYSALQSEPRYSIPFRSFEMLLAMTGCSMLIHRIRALTRPQAATVLRCAGPRNSTPSAGLPQPTRSPRES